MADCPSVPTSTSYSQLMEVAKRHQAVPRERAMEPADTLLISECEGHNHTVGISGRQIWQVISDVLPARESRKLLTSVEEAHGVFAAHSTEVMPTFSVRGGGEQATLAGGAPLLDHLKAYISNRLDWEPSLTPVLDRFAKCRMSEAYQLDELTIGVTDEKRWESATAEMLESIRLDREAGVLFTAADCESFQADMNDSPLDKGFEGVLNRIKNARDAGRHSVHFNCGHKSKGNVTSFPVRFFVGGANWAVHVRLPLQSTTFKGRPRLLLDLTTKITPGVKAFFKAIPNAVGCGIMDDFRQWSEMTLAVWEDCFFCRTRLPIEMGDLLRMAGVAMTQSSMFVCNWWTTGTIMPKDQASRGDNRWAESAADLPKSLRRYLVLDTRQPAMMASLLSMVWTIHHLPDAFWVHEVSGMTPLMLMNWVASKVMRRLLPNIRPVYRKLAEGGPIDTYMRMAQLVKPEGINSYSELLSQCEIPSGVEWEILARDPGWPSITAGGPCFIHSARSFMVGLLPLLRAIDPQTWSLGQVDQLVLYQFGLPVAPYVYPSCPSSNTGPWEPNPDVTNPIVENAESLSKRDFQEHAVATVRGARAMFLEYVRLYPWSGRDMLEYFEGHTKHFKELVGVKRFRQIIHDIRRCLEFMGMMPVRPPGWTDPFFVHLYIEKLKANASVALKRRREELTSGLQVNTGLLELVEDAIREADDPNIQEVGPPSLIRRWQEAPGALRPPGRSNADRVRGAAGPQESLPVTAPLAHKVSQEPPARRQRLDSRPSGTLQEEVEMFIDRSEMEMFGPE